MGCGQSIVKVLIVGALYYDPDRSSDIADK
jgi:hypothetical protein